MASGITATVIVFSTDALTQRRLDCIGRNIQRHLDGVHFEAFRGIAIAQSPISPISSRPVSK